jgi:predicted DNA-binding transcriptional regulator AlpA
MSLPKLIRFSDLKAQGILSNRMTLGHWIEREGFPPGRVLGPNTRVWDEAEVKVWLDRRPSQGTKRPTPPQKCKHE